MLWEAWAWDVWTISTAFLTIVLTDWIFKEKPWEALPEITSLTLSLILYSSNLFASFCSSGDKLENSLERDWEKSLKEASVNWISSSGFSFPWLFSIFCFSLATLKVA